MLKFIWRKKEPVWNGLNYHRPGSWWQPIQWWKWLLVNPLVPKHWPQSTHSLWFKMTKSAQVIINNTKSNSSQWNSHFFQSSLGILWCTQELCNLKLSFISNESEQIKPHLNSPTLSWEPINRCPDLEEVFGIHGTLRKLLLCDWIALYSIKETVIQEINKCWNANLHFS